MGDTTLTLDAETKDRLDEDFRGGAHYSWDVFFTGIMEILPTVEQLRDGCSHCDRPFQNPERLEKNNGALQFFYTTYDDNDVHGNAVYCSAECAAIAQEEVEKMAATEPDKLIIGGMDERRMEVEMNDLHLFHANEHEERKEISVPVPLHLEGEDAHGNGFDYHGEPIYVENAGKIRFSGIIDEIFREETHTALYMGRAVSTEMQHHPNEEKREEWIANYEHWYDQECPDCGADLRVNESMDAEIECGECETMIERYPVPEDEIPDVVLSHRANSG